MAIGFELILLQITNATTPETIANSITALITSIGSLAVTVGTVIGLIFTFLKARDAHGIATRAENIGIKVGQYATAFGAKTIENKENIIKITEIECTLNVPLSHNNNSKNHNRIRESQ